ncbi:MAG: DUF2812 domain-containing protein [Coprobacillus sp.]
MKYKYIYAKDKLLIEDDCIVFLEKMSKQGWKLKRIFLSVFIFERCNEPLKYQLDYNDYDQEYIDIIEELGYEYICLYNNIKFYCHKDLNAIDLQTDPTIHELLILKKYSFSSIMGNFGMLLIFLIFLQTVLDYSPFGKQPADFYLYFNNEVLAICLYFLIALLFLQTIKNIDIRYKNQT